MIFLPEEKYSTSARGVLITRPATEAARMAALIEARGFEPVLAPLLNIAPRAVDVPRHVQAVLVTSANALPALPAWPVPLLAVGDSTAFRARAQGFSTVISAGGTAADLARLAAGHCDPAGAPLLLAHGRGQGQNLKDTLQMAGFKVIMQECYAAEPVAILPQPATLALQAGTLHAATFLSRETALAFTALLPANLRPPLASLLAIAIGEPAADVLRGLPWRAVRTALSPTLDDVLALL